MEPAEGDVTTLVGTVEVETMPGIGRAEFKGVDATG